MYTHILFATDLRENHFNLCKQAAEIATCFGAKLYLLHVIEPPASLQLAQGLGFAEFYRPIKDDAETVLSQQLVEVGSIKEHVLSKAADLACNLIIIGSHTPSNLPTFLGSTAHAVVNHAHCDVLTLRAS